MFHLILFFFVFSNLQFLAGWIVPPVKSNEFLSWTQYSVKEHKKKWTEHIGQRGVIWECFYFVDFNRRKFFNMFISPALPLSVKPEHTLK